MTPCSRPQRHGAGHIPITTASPPPLASSVPLLPLGREVLAHFTGYWPAGFRPRWRRQPWWHLLMMLLTLVGSITASTVFVLGSPSWWPLLGLSWMVTVHAARKAQLVIIHYAVHGTLTGSQRYNRALGEGLSILLFLQPFDAYHRAHVQIHHSRRLATLADPDVQFLLLLGFRPGMSRHALWHHLCWTVVSPRFHGLFLWQRLRANFLTAPVSRCLLSAGYATALVGMLILTQAWLPFVVGVLIPLVPLYHVAALAQFLSEHLWLAPCPTTNAPGSGGRPLGSKSSPVIKRRIGRVTCARFVGDLLPSGSLPLAPWLGAYARWVGRLLFLHIPTRLCVLPGDVIVHDFHHRHVHGDWANAFYERQRDRAAGCPGWPEAYQEIWGLDHAIDAVFATLAALPPLPEPAAMSREVAQGVLTM